MPSLGRDQPEDFPLLVALKRSFQYGLPLCFNAGDHCAHYICWFFEYAGIELLENIFRALCLQTGSNQICFAVDVAFLGKMIDFDGLGQMKQGSNRKYLFEIHGPSVALDISRAAALIPPLKKNRRRSI